MPHDPYPVPDAYPFLIVMLATLAIGLAINLVWLAVKERSLNYFIKRLRISCALLLWVIVILLAIETILMVFFECSYFDVIAYIVSGAFEWRPSLIYGWMIAHRIVLILYLLPLIYLLLSKTSYYLWSVSHLKKIKKQLTGDLLRSKLKNPRSIKIIAVCGLIWGIYCLVQFFIILSISLDLFDAEIWSFATGFGSYDFNMVLGSLISLIWGFLLVATSARLLYLKKDAWWITLIVLSLCEFSLLNSLVYFLTHKTFGGILNVAYALVFCMIFAISIYSVLRNAAAYRVGTQNT